MAKCNWAFAVNYETIQKNRRMLLHDPVFQRDHHPTAENGKLVDRNGLRRDEHRGPDELRGSDRAAVLDQEQRIRKGNLLIYVR